VLPLVDGKIAALTWLEPAACTIADVSL